MTVRERAELPIKWGWLLALGIGLVVGGAVGLALSSSLTLASVLVFGALALVAGAFQLWYGVTWKVRNWSGRALHLMVAIAYLALGSLLLWDPVSGTFSLTLVLAAFLIAIGVSRLIYAWKCQRRGWRWRVGFLAGLIDLILSGLIVYGWPGTAFWVIGLFVAIEMMLSGWMLVGIALAVRAASKNEDQPAHDSSQRETAHATQ